MGGCKNSTARKFHQQDAEWLQQAITEVRESVDSRLKFSPPKKMTTLKDRAQMFEYELYRHYHPFIGEAPK
jgi:hypothetical protein